MSWYMLNRYKNILKYKHSVTRGVLNSIKKIGKSKLYRKFISDSNVQFIFVKYISKVTKRFYSLEILPLLMRGNSCLCRFRRQIGTVFRAFHH